jgi:hypothetical protein
VVDDDEVQTSVYSYSFYNDAAACVGVSDRDDERLVDERLMREAVCFLRYSVRSSCISPRFQCAW